MKSINFLLLACLISISQAGTSNASRNFDSEDRPNPMDAKNITLTIFNNTDMKIKTSFFSGNKKVAHGKIIEPKQSLIYEVEGRYNKKESYFRFRIPGKEARNTGVKFFYKKIGRERGTKIDEIYLTQDEQGNFLISSTAVPNEVTTLVKADINAKLLPELCIKKHKKYNKNEGKAKRHRKSQKNAPTNKKQKCRKSKCKKPQDS